MVDQKIYEQVHQWMEAHKENMIQDIQRLIKVPSISNSSEEVKPFGAACRQAMDEIFPVCYGEKGIIEGKTVSLGSMSENVLEFYGGSAGNIIPDKAVLVIKRQNISEKQLERLKRFGMPITRGVLNYGGREGRQNCCDC